MNRYSLLWHIINLLPIKTKKTKKFLDLLRFYKKGNILTVINTDGTQKINPIKIYPFLHIKASGKNRDNKIIIHENQNRGSNIDIHLCGASNNTINIGTANTIHMVAYVRGNNGRASLGNNNYINQITLYLYCSGKTTFKIGNNNLFSSGIVFWAGEGHSVIDSKTHKVTNIGGNITIGNNNWICMNVCFLKHAKIGNGCVVGYGSVISNDLSKDHKCIIAGNPAHVVKRDILWADKEPWKYNGELYI